MATKGEDKLRKKLKNFFDKNASLNKRWKSLMSYVEKASSEDLNKFFNENFYMIYGVFLDSFQAYENSCKKGKHSNSEVIDLMTILRNVLVHLSELIRKKWQTRSIASVLEKVLCKENKVTIRLIGFELMLIFLDAVQVLEPSQIDLFAQSIDLGPFCVDKNSGAKLRRTALSAPDKGSVLVPSSSAGTMENSVKLWEYMLDYMTQKPSAFEFWFNLLKREYLSIFFPETARKIGLSTDDCGFKAHCPHQVLEVYVARYEAWAKMENVTAVLWASEENILLNLEVLRQACMMPISYAATIRQAIACFRALFFTNPPSVLMSRIVEFRQFFLEQIAKIFSIDEEDKREEHRQLCMDVIALFKQIFMEQYDSFAKETQECLLNTLLRSCIDVCKEDGNKPLAQALAPTFLDTIFFLWIRTKRNTEEMWTTLQDGVSSLFHFMVPVSQTRDKLIQLTMVIRQQLYPQASVKKVTVHRADDPAKPADAVKAAKKKAPMCPDSRPQLPEIPVDPSIGQVEWNLGDAIYVWTQVLNVFRNINSIQDPRIHVAAMEVLTEVVDILQRAEELIPYQLSHYANPQQPKPLCLVDIFGPWFFEACRLPESHIKGKATAVGSLCRLVVRHHGDTLPLKLLAHFYATIFQCLKNHSNSLVSWAILQNSNNLFNIALPGCNTLIPHYVAEVKRVLRSQNTTPKEVKLKSILIVSSLICYPSHLEGLSAPLDPLSSQGASYNFSMQLKKDVSHVLIETAKNDADPEHKVLCIWAMCVLIFEELLNKANSTLVKEITRTIIPFSTHANNQVSRAALDSLSCLVLKFQELRELDESIVQLVVDVVCGNILRLLSEGRTSGTLREHLVADHYYCLQDWVIASGSYVFDRTTLASKLFDAIEMGLLGQKLAMPEGGGPPLPDRKSTKSAGSGFRMKSGSIGGNIENLTDLMDHLDQNPVHGSIVVKEAAKILLVQFCNFMQNFPCKEGIEILCSQVTEADDLEGSVSPPLFYIYNDFALFSLVEVPLEDGSHLARLILRDSTGRYAWDATINYNNYVHEAPPPFSLLCKPICSPMEPEPPIVSQSDRQPGTAPTTAITEGPAVDQLDDLLQYLGEAFPDCLPESGAPLNKPTPPPKTYAKSIDSTRSALLGQERADREAIEYLEQNRPDYPSWATLPPSPPEPLSPVHHCRILLSHLGFSAYENQAHFSMVEQSQRFQRSVAQLDRNSGREMLKIGVIYVREGQDDQKIILRNDTKSELYAEFVRGLGWPIDIATHKGYLGGLDPKLTTGETAPYYANSIMEVVFHEISSMPTHPSDNQQIHKKRHVGNDIVHIVYSEHSSDYRPTTITSQFNDAHIVVYPLPNGLFRVQIYRKESVQLFGPLLHGMCINKQLLPVLVRQTAINANRYVRYNTGGYSRPFPTRQRALEEIMDRFKVKRPYEDLISELMPGPAAVPASQPAQASPSKATA